MKICVTGATGFIGINLTLRLANSGHTVHAICRSESKERLIRHDNVKVFRGHILDAINLENAMQSCDVVFHLAAYAHVWARNPEVYYQVNVEGTRLILATAARLGIMRVVVTSTAGIFGPSLNGEIITEDTVSRIAYLNDYDRSKAMADELIRNFLQEGPEVISVFPTRVYGPGLLNDSNSVTKMISRYISGKWHFIPSDGESTGNYVYIDDVVKGHILAMEKGIPGSRYILGGENVSFNEFFNVLQNISGTKYRLFHFPDYLMLVFSKFIVFFADLTGISPLITPGFVRRYLYKWSFTSEKAVKELGYTITPLKEGMSKTIKWIRSNN
jgi:farnesol dehydrogenase